MSSNLDVSNKSNGADTSSLANPVMAPVETATVQQPEVTEDRMIADAIAGGLAINAMTMAAFSRGTFGEVSMEDCALSLRASAAAVSRGDSSSSESLLVAQAATLNAIFGEMARRASLSLGGSLEGTERYLRLALKAQGQCRTTLETLAAVRASPLVFVRQANIVHGPQQVNNGTVNPSAHAPPLADELQIKPNELLEVTHGPWLDTSKEGAASRTDSHLAPVGTRDRA